MADGSPVPQETLGKPLVQPINSDRLSHNPASDVAETSRLEFTQSIVTCSCIQYNPGMTHMAYQDVYFGVSQGVGRTSSDGDEPFPSELFSAQKTRLRPDSLAR